MNTVAKRLEVHFAALAAVGAVAAIGATAQNADAAVVSSGIVNLNIPSTTDGLYLNVVTGLAQTVGPFTAGWDVNPYSSSGLSYFNASVGPTYVQRTGGGATGNLPGGTLIDAASLYGNIGASTTGLQAHVLNGGDNYIGFRFINEANANAIHFGWMRITVGTALNAQPRTLVEYAYESVAGVGITTPVPAPTAGMGVLALGGLGLLGRRRK